MSATNAVEILLVEDNPRDVDLTLRAMKKRNLANNVHVVTDGAEALEWVFGEGRYAGRNIDHRPKVILLDLKLPKVDGLEVLQQLKSDERTRMIPVVVLTSSSEETRPGGELPAGCQQLHHQAGQLRPLPRLRHRAGPVLAAAEPGAGGVSSEPEFGVRSWGPGRRL